MLNDLCIDLFYNLTKYLSIKDIYKLKNCNKNCYKNIKDLSNNIVLNKLKCFYLHDKNQIKKQFYNFIENDIKFFYKNKVIEVVNNKYINKLYRKILNYFIINKDNKNINVNIYGYPDIFELYLFFMFSNSYIHKNINNRYLIDFVNESNTENVFNDFFYDDKIEYFININYHVHNKLTFINYDLLVDVSSYVCSLCILRNIFCYKKLNLKNAKLYQCCHFCAFKCIEEICNIKRLFYRDALISENYRKIKDFLKIKNIDYYNLLLNRENIEVDNLIYIKNPLNNRMMKINTRSYKNKMLEIYDLDKKSHRIIINYIKRKRYFLKRRIYES